MATYTPNLNLKKPSTGELYDVVAAYHDAMDKLDAEVGSAKSQLLGLPVNLSKFPRVIPEINDFGRIQRALNSFPANGGVLEIPVGEYFIPNGGLTCDKPITIQGAGAGTYESDGTRFICDSPTAFLLTLNKPGVVVSGIAFVNTSATRPTAGAGLLMTDFDFGRIERCLFRGFWNNVQVDSGYFYSIRDTAFLAPVNYGCYMRNTSAGQNDHGDQVLEGCNFSKYGDTNSGGTAVQWESGGGLRIVGCKVNAGTQPGYPDTGFFDNGFVTNMQAGGTSVHTITGCSIEGWLKDGIKIGGVVGADFGKIAISGNEFLASGNGGYCINADGQNMLGLNNIVISGNVGYGVSGGVSLANLTKAVVTGNDFADCVGIGLFLANVTKLVQADNLFGVRIWDDDASAFDSSSGHYRGKWLLGKDVNGLTASLVPYKVKPGEFSQVSIKTKVVGNVATHGGILKEQTRVFERALGNVLAPITTGTDISIGSGADQVTIFYDITEYPEFVGITLTSATGLSFNGYVEIEINGIVNVIELA